MICHMMYTCVGEAHVHRLYMHIPCVRVTMDVQMVLRQNTAVMDSPQLEVLQKHYSKMSVECV